jgi:hypothetical protein
MNIKFLLTTTCIATALSASAQKADVGYAITGDGNKDFIWMNIREVDLNTGTITKTLFERSKTPYQLIDVNTKKVTTADAIKNGNIFSTTDYPTSTFVAAAALDARGKKLYFTPMRMGELRWLDLNIKNGTPTFYTLRSEVLNFSNTMNSADEAKNITRMVIAPNGKGYAVTNDASHLIEFTTGKIPVIKDLGSLIDAEENKGVSIANKCTSWGGDMIADAFGKLYIVSANKNVFVIDPQTRIATHKGSIKGLPAQYTANGAAVAADGDIIVTSANFFEGYYKVKLADLTAVKMEGSDVKYNAADLANGRFLLQKEADKTNQLEPSELPAPVFTGTESKIYPNPVTNGQFYVSLEGQKDGRYHVLITDLAGRTLQSTPVQVAKGKQMVRVAVMGRPVKGMYMVKVVNSDKQTVITDKIIIE